MSYITVFGAGSMSGISTSRRRIRRRVRVKKKEEKTQE